MMTFLLTLNLSAQWSQESTQTILTGVNFSDSLHGVVIGDSNIIVTNDASNWYDVSPNPHIKTNATTRKGTSEVWAVGNGIVIMSANSGSTWQNIFNPRPQNKFTDIKTSGNWIWILGNDTSGNCTIMGTTNRGITWKATPLGKNYQKMLVLDSIHIWIYGDRGSLMETYDAGDNWINHQIDSTVNIKGLTFNGQLGYLVGQCICSGYLYTNNGGQTWTGMNWSVVPTSLANLNFMLFASTIDTLGSGKIMTSINEGLNWSVSLALDTGIKLIDFSTPDTNNLWAVARNKIYHYRKPQPPPPNQNPVFIDGPQKDTVIATQTYVKISLASDVDGDTLLYFKLSGPATMLTDSITSLTTWQTTKSDTGWHTILHQVRDDKGGTDQRLDSILVLPKPNQAPMFTRTGRKYLLYIDSLFQDTLSATDVDSGDVLRFSYDNHPASFQLDSVNGQINWQTALSDTGTQSINFYVFDQNNAYAELTDTFVVMTRSILCPVFLQSVVIDTIAIVGKNYTSAAFQSQDPQNYNLTYSLSGPGFLGIDSNGTVSGIPAIQDIGYHLVSGEVNNGRGGISRRSYMLRVISNANPPVIITQVTNTNAYPGVRYAAPLTALYDGPDSLTWSIVNGPTWLTIKDVDKRSCEVFGTPSTLYIGTVYYVQVQTQAVYNGGSDQYHWLVYVRGPNGIGDELSPTTFALAQNYPNPFNPATVIKFSIPNQQFVTLKIYNYLGQQVTDLVNEVTDAGVYSVNWNAEGLPSGSYTYRLITEGFIETKKMLLIR
ncbi:MAG: YCF48-related protein [Patescibacteria group bacterium]